MSDPNTQISIAFFDDVIFFKIKVVLEKSLQLYLAKFAEGSMGCTVSVLLVMMHKYIMTLIPFIRKFCTSCYI
jgi:hypothetical protein